MTTSETYRNKQHSLMRTLPTPLHNIYMTTSETYRNKQHSLVRSLPTPLTHYLDDYQRNI